METLYAGIDLHSNNNVVVIIDKEETVVFRRKLSNGLDMVLTHLAPFKEQLDGIVVESTYNWYWLVDGLQEHGYPVHLANTGAIEQYSGLKYGNDESDARWLANLLRLNILPEGYIYPKEERPVRDLMRKRMGLVRKRTSCILSVKNLIVRNTGGTPTANWVKRVSDEEIDSLFEDPCLALPVKCTLNVIRYLDQEIVALEKAALERVKLRDDFKCLLTATGIGNILALTIMLETGDIGRFPSVGDYASYARCVGSKRVSNGKQKGKGNTKCGNAYLAWAFAEAAAFATRYDKDIQSYYQRKLARASHPMVARKAVAHKLARACYHMLRDQTPFDVKRAFT